jgi:hypothetical protein
MTWETVLKIRMTIANVRGRSLAMKVIQKAMRDRVVDLASVMLNPSSENNFTVCCVIEHIQHTLSFKRAAIFIPDDAGGRGGSGCADSVADLQRSID